MFLLLSEYQQQKPLKNPREPIKNRGICFLIPIPSSEVEFEVENTPANYAWLESKKGNIMENITGALLICRVICGTEWPSNNPKNGCLGGVAA